MTAIMIRAAPCTFYVVKIVKLLPERDCKGKMKDGIG